MAGLVSPRDLAWTSVSTQQLNCVFLWNGCILCFGALFFFWNSGHSWWTLKIHLFIFFVPISFPHGQVPCSGCGLRCLQCYLVLVRGQVGESLSSHWPHCHHKGRLSPPRAGPTCRKRILGLLWASHRFLPAKTACGVKTWMWFPERCFSQHRWREEGLWYYHVLKHVPLLLL